MSEVTTTRLPEERTHEEKITAEAVFSGTVAEGLVAGLAAALAIISLAGEVPGILMSIAVIALGGAMLFEGAAIVSRLRNLVAETTGNRVKMFELGSGLTAESMSGVLGITLGILSIFGLVPLILIPAAVIGIGLCLIFGAGANMRLASLEAVKPAEHPMVRKVAREAVFASTGLQVVTGLGGIALGIIALVGIAPAVLSEVAVLGMGAAILLSGTALASRMLSLFKF